MIVVSDTSAITSLIQIGREDLLPKLFSRVVIPQKVRQELMQFHPTIPSFLETVSISRSDLAGELPAELDRGEVEAIILAEEIASDYLLMDDLAARSAAIARGLPVIGLLGILIKAKRAGLVAVVAAVIDDLEKVAGFRISADLREEILRVTGES